MRLGGHKAVLVRAIALAASSCEPPASSKSDFKWMNQLELIWCWNSKFRFTAPPGRLCLRFPPAA